MGMGMGDGMVRFERVGGVVDGIEKIDGLII